MDRANLPPDQLGLTRSQFDHLLRRLDPDEDCASEKYEILRWKLINFFEWSSYSCAEDLADETLDRVARQLGEQQIQDAVGFTWGVAKRIKQEAHKRMARTVPLLDLPKTRHPDGDYKTAEGIIHEKLENEQRLKCLGACIERWPQRDGELFLAYHSIDGNSIRERQVLAQNFGLTVNALRVRINRLRKRLGKDVNESMKRIP
jgi:DNA-directed RNA polymerase specialized sigma24 family protein